jgi:hypothetical protein
VARTEQQKAFDRGYWTAITGLAGYVIARALIRRYRKRGSNP